MSKQKIRSEQAIVEEELEEINGRLTTLKNRIHLHENGGIVHDPPLPEPPYPRSICELREQVARLECRLNTHLQQENHLAGRLEFFDILMDSIPNPCFFQDLEGDLLFCNLAFESMLQRVREEMVERPMDSFVKDEQLCALVNKPYDPKSFKLAIAPKEGEVTYGDGSTRHIEVRHTLYFSLKGEPSGTVGTIIDLTDRKRAEKAEIEAAKLRTLQEIAISIAHEFNNPLMIISGVEQLIRLRLGDKLDEDTREHMARIPRAVKRMTSLVKRLCNLKTIKEAEYAAGQQFIDIAASSEED